MAKDRFSRIAEKATADLAKCSCADDCSSKIRESHIQYLIEKPLRNEHRWFRDLVKRLSEDHPNSTLFRDCLLTKLNARAR